MHNKNGRVGELFWRNSFVVISECCRATGHTLMCWWKMPCYSDSEDTGASLGQGQAENPGARKEQPERGPPQWDQELKGGQEEGPGSSQWRPATRQGAMGPNWNLGSST